MTAGNRRRAEELFQIAADLPAEEHPAFLDEHCGDDAALRAELERLLRALEDEGDDLLAEPAMAVTGPIEPGEGPGDRIGPFKLLTQLGEGGFGVVYLAEQDKPVRRRVALKIIKLGMDTKQVIARFEAERQALAVMDHPHVAKVFDAGATDTGRPYFVMEHVAGVSITEHCDRQRLSIEQRIELFMLVCEAVQHAHQKGIIHRDIKPSNVLVAAADGKAIPKIIDFGVAKAIDHRLTEKTIYTEQGQFIGTPEYMSPEQAEMTAQGIDTRSDIYSLGVLLYELLTGARPFDLRRAAFGEIQRVIREQEPPKPSTRLSSLGDLATSASQRRANPKTLLHELRGDLDWILIKTLEKDRDRRYQTANSLAVDLRRHLDNKPVEAGPPSAAYRFRKFVRRNRAGVAAASVAALSLMVAAAVSVWFALSEADQRAIAEERAVELEAVVDFQSRTLRDVNPATMGRSIIANLRQSAASSLLAEEIEPAHQAELLAAFDRAIGSVNPTNLALQTLDEHILARTAKAIGSSFADQPLTEASLQLTLGNTYRALGLHEEAVPPLKRALEIRRRHLGNEHPRTLTSLNDLGFALVLRGLPVGDMGEAEKYLLESLETCRRIFGDKDWRTLHAMHMMALLLQQQGRFDEAEPLRWEAMKGLREVLGDEHKRTLSAISDLSFLLGQQGRLVEAMKYSLEANKGLRKVRGNDHRSTMLAINGTCILLLQQGKLVEAEPYCREAMESRRRVLGDEHFQTRFSINNVVKLLIAQEKYADAEQLARGNLPGKVWMRAEEDWHTADTRSLLGESLVGQGQYEEAEPHLLEGHAGLDATTPIGRRRRHLPPSVERLVHLYEAWGKPDKAAEWRAKLPTEQDAVASDTPADEKQEE